MPNAFQYACFSSLGCPGGKANGGMNFGHCDANFGVLTWLQI